MRLDVWLVAHGMAESRTKASAMIKSGSVSINSLTVTQPSFAVDADVNKKDAVSIACGARRFVGRGGEKLAAAVEHFRVDFTGLTGVDLGASTGGFTDCAIQNGAVRMYAVDVGSGQLHPRLLRDSRVVNYESTDARDLILPEECQFVLADLSFISLTKILPAISRLLSGEGFALALVKPQFEQTEHRRHKNGVIRDEKDRREALDRVITACGEYGLRVIGSFASPVKGNLGKGNQEYFLLLKHDK